MFAFKKSSNCFLITHNEKPYILDDKRKIVFDSLKNTKSLIRDLNFLEDKSLLNQEIIKLCIFTSNLSSKDISTIIDQIINQVRFDNILYRSSKDSRLSELMNKKYSYIIEKFSKEFKINLKLIMGTTGHQDVHDSRFIKHFLKKLNKYHLTVIFNLVQISKSVILSYNFIKLNLKQNEFLELSNLENFYNVKRWGQTNENIIFENDIKNKLKNITIFFKEL